MSDNELVIDAEPQAPTPPDASEITAALAGMRATLDAMRAEFQAVTDALRADNEAMRAEMARLRAQLGLPGEPDMEGLSEYDRGVVLMVSQVWRDNHRRPATTFQIADRMGWSTSKIIRDLKRLAREDGVIYEHSSSGDRCSGLWSPMMMEQAG